MIKFKTTYGTIDIPTSYHELKISDYVQIVERSEELVFVFSLLTGLTEQQVQTLDLSSVVPFIDFLKDSANDLEPLDFIEVEGVQITNISIREKTWAQKIAATDAINDLVQLVAVYVTPILNGEKFNPDQLTSTVEKLNEMSVFDVYSFGLDLREQLLSILDIESKRLQSEITPEQHKAGIAEFDVLGVFNTIDMIAGGDVLKYDAVLELDYGTIFNKLLHSNISSKFEKRLNDIMRNQNKGIGK